MELQMIVNGRRQTTKDVVRLFWMEVQREVGYFCINDISNCPLISRQDILDKLTSSKKKWLHRYLLSCQWTEYFDFLDESEYARLNSAVSKVTEIARSIEPNGDATDEQYALATPHFADVVELMGFDRYEHADEYYYGKQIERDFQPTPSILDHLRFMFKKDSTDEQALWIWIYIKNDEEFDDDRFLSHAKDIEQVLEPIARSIAPEGRVYFYYRSMADLSQYKGVFA